MKSKRSKFPMLVSYAFLMDEKPEVVKKILTNPDVEILLDSGAFTGFTIGKEIAMDKYLAFLDQWGKYLFGYIALDKLGDPKQTETNLKIMLKEGFKPIPVHVRGDNQKRMDELFEMSDWVACGGFMRPGKGHCDKTYVKEKMKWAKGRNVHWLGYTRFPMIKIFKPYSCDCSSWSYGIRFGWLQTYRGFGKFGINQWKDFQEKGLDRIDMKAVRDAGFSSIDLQNKARWRHSKGHEGDTLFKHSVLMQVNILSWVRYIRDVRENLGTRLFLATLPTFTDIICEHIEATR